MVSSASMMWGCRPCQPKGCTFLSSQMGGICPGSHVSYPTIVFLWYRLCCQNQMLSPLCRKEWRHQDKRCRISSSIVPAIHCMYTCCECMPLQEWEQAWLRNRQTVCFFCLSMSMPLLWIWQRTAWHREDCLVWSAVKGGCWVHQTGCRHPIG